MRLEDAESKQYVFSFSGADYIPFAFVGGRLRALPLVMTITASFVADQAPALTLGSKVPLTIRPGHVTVAGSIIGAVSDVHPLFPLTSLFVRDVRFGTDVALRTYELPLFDIIIVGINEVGRTTVAKVYGARIQQGGYTYSIQDLYTETTFQYRALDMDEPQVAPVMEGEMMHYINPAIFFDRLNRIPILAKNKAEVGAVLGVILSLRAKLIDIYDKIANAKSIEEREHWLQEAKNVQEEIRRYEDALNTTLRLYSRTVISGNQFADAVFGDLVWPRDLKYVEVEKSYVYPQRYYASVGDTQKVGTYQWRSEHETDMWNIYIYFQQIYMMLRDSYRKGDVPMHDLYRRCLDFRAKLISAMSTFKEDKYLHPYYGEALLKRYDELIKQIRERL